MTPVAAGLIRNTIGQVLLAKNPPEHQLAGYWEFPGGKREANEALEQTLVREIDEEFGLAIAQIEPFGKVAYSYDHLDIQLHGFLAVAQGEIHQARAHETYEWVAITNIHRYELAPADQILFEKFLKLS